MKVKRERSWEKNPGRFSGAVLRDDMLTAYLSDRPLTPAHGSRDRGCPHLSRGTARRRAGSRTLGG
ncbi:hypothetical protein GCM10017586_05680 [Microbacterium imperiale]|uniref:Uncharacterized protein n=1 Tax=Microbacterium imperiale TaxID=33884 RepID=A0A9W6M2F1_9MICO|nr:hypothetical protein GCM10017586_05680 [Microbacterium imperiale]